MTVPDTDAAGVTDVDGTIGDLADTTLPLKAMIKVSIHEPGGRTTDKTVDIPVRTRDVLIGIRPDFDDGSVRGERARRLRGDRGRCRRQAHRAVRPDLFLGARRHDLSVVSRTNGEWKYQSVTRDRLITRGSMAIGAGAPAKLAQTLPWGTYRLTITDPKSGAASSYRFYSGWAASAAGDRPDRIPVAADKPSYRAGETAHVHIKPTANGKALVVVAGDRCSPRKLIDAPAGGTQRGHSRLGRLGRRAPMCWSPTIARSNEATGREPVRSIGLAWLGVDNSPRTLTRAHRRTGEDHAAPEDHHPGHGEGARQRRGRVSDARRGGRRHPAAHRFQIARSERLLLRQAPARRRHARRLRPPDQGREGRRSARCAKAATASAGARLRVVPTKTVALFSGLVKVGAGGIANVPLDVPDFNGELRLMAVACERKTSSAMPTVR